MSDLILPALEGTSAHGWLTTVGLARVLAEEWPDLTLHWGVGGWTCPVFSDGPATVEEATVMALRHSLGRLADGAVLPGVDADWPAKGDRFGAAPTRVWTGAEGLAWQQALVTPLGDLHPLIRPHAAQTLRGILDKIVTVLRKRPALLTEALTGLGLTDAYPAGLWVLRSDSDGRDPAASPGRDWLMLMGLPWAPVAQIVDEHGQPHATAPGWRRHDTGPHAETLTWRLWSHPMPVTSLDGMDLEFADGPEHVAYRSRRTKLTRFDPPALRTDRAARGRGRPKIGPKVHVNLTAEQLARVDARAAFVGATRADMLRDVVDRGLDALDAATGVLPA